MVSTQLLKVGKVLRIFPMPLLFFSFVTDGLVEKAYHETHCVRRVNMLQMRLRQSEAVCTNQHVVAKCKIGKSIKQWRNGVDNRKVQNGYWIMSRKHES
jgi:hypothetical protein